VDEQVLRQNFTKALLEGVSNAIVKWLLIITKITRRGFALKHWHVLRHIKSETPTRRRLIEKNGLRKILTRRNVIILLKTRSASERLSALLIVLIAMQLKGFMLITMIIQNRFKFVGCVHIVILNYTQNLMVIWR
jgi:hypothetical protein